MGFDISELGSPVSAFAFDSSDKCSDVTLRLVAYEADFREIIAREDQKRLYCFEVAVELWIVLTWVWRLRGRDAILVAPIWVL